MQSTLENLGQLERRLSVAVAAARVDDEVQKRLKNIARSAKLPGFRPGKVPMKIVSQQYEPQVRSEVLSEAVEKGFSDAVREQNLRVAGYPRIEPKPGGAEGQLEFHATFEVYPDIALDNLAEATIKRPVAEVTAADVDRTIEILRKQRAIYAPVERALRAGDQATTDFTGTIDGVEFAGGQAKDFSIIVGEGRMLPEFEAALPGMSAGESKTFALNFPPDYHGKEVAGKTAEFKLTVTQVAEPVLPEVDADFARAFGIEDGDIERLKSEIAANLKLELKRRVRAELRSQAMQVLRERATLTLPNALVEMEVVRLYRGAMEDMKQRGLKVEDGQIDPTVFRAGAEDRVRLGLILSDVMQKNALDPKPEQIRALVVEAAQSYEFPDDVVAWHYQQRERLAEFEAQAMEDNVIDWLLTQAKVEERPTSFQELTESNAAQA